MTAATTAGYTASASSQRDATYPAYQAFNNIFNSGSYTDGWNNATNTNYDGTDNSYNPSADTPTRNLGIGAVDGEWLKLELPVKVLLQTFKIYSRWNDPTRAPEDFRVYGSNDNANWTELLSVSGQQPPASGQEYEIIQTNVHYKYFGLVVTKIWSQNNYFAIDLVEYYGTPEYDPEAHGADVIVRSVPNVPNTDWLEVYWDGQDYTSMPPTVTDKSGNGLSGTPSGGVGFDTEYKAFTFDGVDDEISSTLSVSGEYIHSISLWVKADEVSRTAGTGVYTFFTIGVTSAVNMIALGVNMDSSGDGIKYDFVNASVSARSNEVVPHRWMHFVVTYTGGANDASDAKRIYLNGKKLGVTAAGSSSSSALNLPSNPILKLGGEVNASNPRFSGSIANFRLFNRAITADEVWQLYAYQKEYFGHGNLDMTLKGGRLGIGTSEPRAVLDVQGSIMSSGYILQKNFVCCRWINGGDKSVSTSEKIPFDGIVYDPNNLWSTVSDAFVAPVTGVYLVHVNLVTDSTTSSDGNHELYVNDSILTPRHRGLGTVTGANAARTANCHYIIPLQAGDELSIRSTSATIWYGSTIHAHSHVSIHLISDV
jgi:hypothetical protein